MRRLVEERDDLRGDGAHHERVLDLFCEFASIPADEPSTRDGELSTVGDDSDCDLLLHESGLSYPDEARYQLSLTRQFSFITPDGDYDGMNTVRIVFECPDLPPGRVTTAQRWGYAGRRRSDVQDDVHPEIGKWAGHVAVWGPAVRASNSWRVLAAMPPSRFLVSQSDV